jgi:hypothetical protein
MGIMIPPDKRIAQLILATKEEGGKSTPLAPRNPSGSNSVDPVSEDLANELVKAIAANDVSRVAKIFETFVSYIDDKNDLVEELDI